jgi:CheY-like chemotaxis protein
MVRPYVLAVEHDWRIRKLIRANLEPLGLEVREAVSVQHGLQRLCQGRPALILLNLGQPGADALHLLHTFHQQMAGRPAPIVALLEEPPSRQLLQEGRLAGYLLKPFAVPALLELIQAILSKEGE